MPDFRAYSLPSEKDPAEIVLGPDESHHLVVVNRCGRGDPVVVFDGRGNEWICECLDPARNGAVLRVKESRRSPHRLHQITLGQALPKGPAMDDIIRQATEIGATRIVPLLSERTQVHLDGDRQEKKLEKWRMAAIEAAKQCGNPWLPEITPIIRFEEFLAKRWASVSTPTPVADVPLDGLGVLSGSASLTTLSLSTGLSNGEIGDHHPLKLIASLCPGTSTLKSALAHFRSRHGGTPQQVLWLIGPEGDFSPAEMTAAITAGFQPITLGPLVLRSDTAAVFALSILSYELGNA